MCERHPTRAAFAKRMLSLICQMQLLTGRNNILRIIKTFSEWISNVVVNDLQCACVCECVHVFMLLCMRACIHVRACSPYHADVNAHQWASIPAFN